MNRIKDYNQLANNIVKWIKDYAIQNNISSLVVGVSGGIDSAVVSTLCAMTDMKTHCCIIDVYNNKEHIDIAKRHLYQLKKQYPTILERHVTNLNKTFDTFKEDIYTKQYITDNHRALPNIKSRLRMIELYYRSSIFNGIVLGTGNKVEDFGIGFATKGGDLCVDISPIADLYKSEVYELARHLGVSQEIIDAPPTDGLWEDGRDDQSQIGATYEELEWVMEEYNSDPHSDVYYTPRQMEVVGIYNRLHNKNLHKMVQIPMFKLNN